VGEGGGVNTYLDAIICDDVGAHAVVLHALQQRQRAVHLLRVVRPDDVKQRLGGVPALLFERI
jgi:hypothetical protein